MEPVRSVIRVPRDDVRMKLMRRVVVFDAADLATESAFWASMLDGRVLPDDTWHRVFDTTGRGAAEGGG